MVVAGKGLGNIKATHSTKFLFFLEKEKLVCLHQKLSADFIVVVDHDVVHTMLVQLFATSQSGRASPNNGHLGFKNLHRLFRVYLFGNRSVVLRNFFNLTHAINLGDANSFYLSINQHFAGTTFTDATFQRTVSVSQTVAVHRKPRLVQGSSNGKPFFALDGLPVESEFYLFNLWYFEYWMSGYFVHF